MMRYAIVIEKATGNYSAYVPDLPGCIATGETIAEVERELREAIRFHIEGLEEDGLPIPATRLKCRYASAIVLALGGRSRRAAKICLPTTSA